MKLALSSAHPGSEAEVEYEFGLGVPVLRGHVGYGQVVLQHHHLYSRSSSGSISGCRSGSSSVSCSTIVVTVIIAVVVIIPVAVVTVIIAIVVQQNELYS